MIRRCYAVATPTFEFLQPARNYSDAISQMRMGDLLYQRTITTVEYRGGGYEIPGDWVPIPVPGLSHCAVCSTKTDLAPGCGFNRHHLYCVDHWCEITEHLEDELRWQQRHSTDQQAA